MSSESESVPTDVDAMSSSSDSDESTDVEGCESADIDSSSSDSCASTYSACFSSSTTSNDDLPVWASIRRKVLQLGRYFKLLYSNSLPNPTANLCLNSGVILWRTSSSMPSRRLMSLDGAMQCFAERESLRE